MVKIKPLDFQGIHCPGCKSTKDNIKITGLRFPGMHVFAELNCKKCKGSFLFDLPIGHSLLYPVHITKEGKLVNTNPRLKWLSNPVINGFNNPDNGSLNIRIIKKRNFEKVILLNCLDYLYGHSLLKLLNAGNYLNKFPDIGLILLIQKNFEWLIPDGTAEAWIVDCPMKSGNNWFTFLEKEIPAELSRFKEVYLGMGYAHPSIKELNIADFVKIPAFNLNNWLQRAPVITFIYREDRLIHPTKIEREFYRLAEGIGILTKVPLIKQFFLYRQKKYLNQYFHRLKNSIPEITIQIAGIGKRNLMRSNIIDLRKSKLKDEDELTWAKAYSQSNLVVGIHGSNMLLPTALAGGFIEILPEQRLGNITQDIVFRHDARTSHYLGRFTDEFISAKNLAKLTADLLLYFPDFYINTDDKFQPMEVLNSIDFLSPEIDSLSAFQ